ncbi:MAG: hypothetical protein ACI9A7_001890, partial [Cyclobacteriaceae bacterium]
VREKCTMLHFIVTCIMLNYTINVAALFMIIIK